MKIEVDEKMNTVEVQLKSNDLSLTNDTKDILGLLEDSKTTGNSQQRRSRSGQNSIDLDVHARELLNNLNHLGKVMEKIGVDYRLGGILNFLLYKICDNSCHEFKLYRQHNDLDIVISYNDAEAFFEKAKKAGYEICTYKILGKNQYKCTSISFDEYKKNNTSFIVMVPKENINTIEYRYDMFDLFINKCDEKGNEIIYRDIVLDKKYLDSNLNFTTIDGHKIPISNQVEVILRKLQNCRVKDIQDIHRSIQNDYGVKLENIDISLELIDKALKSLLGNVFDDLKAGMHYNDLLCKYKQEDYKLFHGKVFGTSTTEYVLERIVRVFESEINKEDYIQKGQTLFYETQAGSMIKSVRQKIKVDI